MRSKILIAVIIILILAVVIGLVYYVINIMIVWDKDGMIYKAQDNTTTLTEVKDDSEC